MDFSHSKMFFVGYCTRTSFLVFIYFLQEVSVPYYYILMLFDALISLVENILHK